MSIELKPSQQYVAPVTASSVTTPDQLSGVSPSNGSVGVSQTSVIPPEDVKSAPAESVPPATPAAADTAPAAKTGEPDISNIVRAAEGAAPVANAPVTNNFTPPAPPVDMAYTDKAPPAADPIAAYKSEFQAANKDPLLELISLTNGFNANPTGKLRNAQQTEFVISRMSKEQLGQIPRLLDEGRLVFTNLQAFVHVKEHIRSINRSSDVPIQGTLLLEHAIAAASLHGQLDVVNNILTTTTDNPDGLLKKVISDIEAQGHLTNAITGKKNSETLTLALLDDIREIAAKADERIQALRKEAEAENAARDAEAAEAAKAQATVPATPPAAQPEASQVQTTPAQAAAPSTLEAPPVAKTAEPASAPQAEATQTPAADAMPAPTTPWQNVVGGQNALNPANFNPATRPATPLVPGR